MGRSRREWTQATFDRYLKEGRGQGSAKDYKPWHRVREVPSKGRSSSSSRLSVKPSSKSLSYGYRY